MKENWRTIPGFPRYQVSDLGRVKSYARSPQGKILDCHRRLATGHVSVSFGRGDGDKPGTVLMVHSLVLLAFVGPVPPGHECLHKNGIPYDNRLKNLRYGTRSENNEDATRHGTRGRFTAEQVKDLRKRSRSGETGKDLGIEFGVSTTAMCNIINRVFYAWVK